MKNKITVVLGVFFCLACDIWAAESMEMVTYYPTPYASYSNVQVNDAKVNPADAAGAKVKLKTADIGVLQVNENLTSDIKKVQAQATKTGKSAAATGTLQVEGEYLKIASGGIPQAQAVNITNSATGNAYAANTIMLGTGTGAKVFPYAKAAVPGASNMVWRSITYYIDPSDPSKGKDTKTFLVIDQGDVAPTICVDKIENVRVWDGVAKHPLCPGDNGVSTYYCGKDKQFVGTCTNVFKTVSDVVRSRDSLGNGVDTLDGDREKKYVCSESKWGYDVYRENGNLVRDYVGCASSSDSIVMARDVTCCDDGTCQHEYSTWNTVADGGTPSADTCDGNKNAEFTCGQNGNFPKTCYDFNGTKQVPVGIPVTTGTLLANQYTTLSSPSFASMASYHSKGQPYDLEEYAIYNTDHTKNPYLKQLVDLINDYVWYKNDLDRFCSEYCQIKMASHPSTQRDKHGNLACGDPEMKFIGFIDKRWTNNYATWEYSGVLVRCESTSEKRTDHKYRTVKCCNK
ncbi:hypothetical protein Emin_0623 [Elusimicrobium minutum Pei191]|uniref:Uncharacterized protein n=1 Tax=Elusimicrobium minutum (strain Pei191) TaxID=445932 RepID=B2KC51_ELUMP|nr:hypothetical protein [Elusimicrobium minutum]ACC98178.1 hypothetical protein Emin_0623 [Elusimicrobium minutum Pei191]